MAEDVRNRPAPEPTWEKDWVECVPKPGADSRVVLWEWHPQHPGGEAFLAPGPARFVALTPAVAYQIQIGALKRVPEPAETLEEWLHQHGHKDAAAPGDYHHIARLPDPEARAMSPRPKPTAVGKR